MWYDPPKYRKEIKDVNVELSKLQGTLDDGVARITLGQFMRRNLGFTVEALSGVQLAPYQIITIKGMLNRNYSLCVFGRGCGKTFTAAIYCILQCLFEPGTNILIAGPTFRTARFIFNHIEKTVDDPNAKLLFQAFNSKPAHRNDEWRWKINGGSIVAIPLNGEKIRGFRANILVIDEFLLMGEEMVEKVLIPYLVAPQDIKWRQKVRAKEDELIRKGVMTEGERMKFSNNAKMIALSSASYTCEYLYKKYEEYIEQIYSPDMPKGRATYFISQLAWNAIPDHMIDKNVIEMAQSNQANNPIFLREYCAQFTDGSQSYFSMKKMLECSVPDGQEPTVLLKGKKNKKYILAIDPNFSSSPTADHFAMCVVELDEDRDKMRGTVVHQYARAGKDLKDHIRYFYYLLKNFNIEFICIDHAGYQFIDAANENELFKKDKIEIKFFNITAEKEGLDYDEELKIARRQFNKEHQCIAFAQYFTSEFIRRGNEHLQGCFDYKKIWFGAPIKGANEDVFNAAVASVSDPDYALLDLKKDGEDESSDTMDAFIDEQERLIKQTRQQCSAIEVKSTIKGTQSFDLPQVMRRTTGADRSRKDSYTALMLAAWALKVYYDLNHIQVQEAQETFTPMMI